jgi:hypothetical protein
LYFSALADRWSAFMIFTVGAVVYLISATLAWIGTLIWRARERDLSHPNNHVS